MADDPLRPHGDVLIVLATTLRIRRTLTGDEIDNTIGIALAHRTLAAERIRRAQWQRRVENARQFKLE
jgi:hypothetical protein